MNQYMIFELARIRQQELLDDAARNRRAPSFRLGRPNLDRLLGAIRTLVAVVAPRSGQRVEQS